MCDTLATTGLTHARRSLRRAYEDGADLDAREDMALAALLSGITLTNAGLGAIHGFAAPLGANFPAPHGVICAALLPHVMAANTHALAAESPDHPALDRYRHIGLLLAPEPNGATAIADGIATISRWVQSLNIPPLSAFGVRDSDVPAMVQLARKSSSMRFNPVALGDEVLADVLRRAL